MMPLIVQSIAADDAELVVSTLGLLPMLVSEAPDMVGQHLSFLIPQLLRLTTYQPSLVTL